MFSFVEIQTFYERLEIRIYASVKIIKMFQRQNCLCNKEIEHFVDLLGWFNFGIMSIADVH